MRKYYKFFVSTILIIIMAFSVSTSALAYTMPSEITVGLESLGKKTSFKISNKSIDIENQDEFNSSKGFTVELDGNKILIIDDSNGEELVSFKNKTEIIYATDGDYINVSGKPYRGELYFVSDGTGLTAVNRLLSIEEYLYGVVPSEMPSSWDIEALKAQAVCARTYTLTKMGAHSAKGYELCDTINCQVYLGVANEAASTTNAVDATAGVIATYDGKPIQALYSASSGGHTDDAKNVWGTDFPYLKGVPEINEIDATKWTREFTPAQIKDLVSESGDNIGHITDIVIVSTENNRVQELKIVGTTGTKTLVRENIRYFFAGQGGSLISRMFTISYVGDALAYNSNNIFASNDYVIGGGNVADKTSKLKDKNLLKLINVKDYVNNNTSTNTSATGKFVITGYGNGHGAGLSQRGAYGMAKLGYTYKEILKYYYTGIEVN